MTGTLILPNNLKNHAIYQIFAEFLNHNPTLPDIVVVDFSNLKFILPPSVAFLSNMTHWFESMGSKVNFVGMDPGRESIKYLDDSGFFRLHTGEPLLAASRCRQTTIPIRQLARRQSHEWLERQFLPWLIRNSGLTLASLAEVKACLQEIFNNISDHTDFEEGCIFGQWYPNKKQIVVTVADFGRGIPENVGKIVSGLSDSQAIAQAVEDGFSSKSLPTNRGAGLYLLLLNVVLRFHGLVTIRSEVGYARFQNLHGAISATLSDNCGYCVGTSIDIVLNTDQIPYAEEEVDFEW